MRSAPAPDLLPIPGMNQGTAVAGGSGGSGGGDGSGGDGSDHEGAGGGKGGADASGDNRNAPDYQRYPTCGTESHPVDVVTGRVFTHPITDLELPGPLPFSFERSYSSAACKEDQGLGYGWAHSLGWFVEVERRRIRVWNDKGVSVDFEVPQIGHQLLGDWGWVLRRELWGFAVDAGDDVWRVFSVSTDEGKTFRLSAIDDRNKNRIALTYDDGKLVEVKDSAGRIIKVTSNKERRITSLEVKNAEHQGQWIAFARYQYDDKGRLVQVTDADGYSWRYEYDEHNRLVRDTDRAGLSFCFRYDTHDRGIEAWGEYASRRDPSLSEEEPVFLADGRTRARGIYHRKFHYHARGYSEVTDTRETRRYDGNRKGLLDKAVTGGAVTTSKYDERGFEVAKSNALGATRQWFRDDRGDIVQFVDALGNVTKLVRDANGLIVELVDPGGGVTITSRDGRGNVEWVKDALGGIRQFTVNEAGQPTSFVNETGARTTYEYDDQYNFASVVQPNGGRWTATHDRLGQLVSIKDPNGAETRYVYSARGDVLAWYTPDGGVTRYTYDGERHITQIVDADGRTTKYEWGGFNVLAARRDANGNLVRLFYSREGELVTVVNERGEVHRFHWSAAGLLIGEDTFDGRRRRCRRDLAGQVLTIEGGGRGVTKHSYDLAGRLVERELPDESVEAYSYDALGNLISATGPAGEIRFERDALGRVVRETQIVGGVEHWTETAYDAAGGRIGRKTSLEHTLAITRDAMGKPARTVLDGAEVLESRTDLLGREIERFLPKGGWMRSEYDPVGRLTRRTAGDSTAEPRVRTGEPDLLGLMPRGLTVDTTYRYDPAGELLASGDIRRGVTQYSYDPTSQLLAVVPSAPSRAQSEAFRYDATGNIQEAGDDAPARVYGLGSRLLRRGTTDYEWDADGRLSEKRTVDPVTGRQLSWRYRWNGADLLQTVEAPDGVQVEFSYDQFARRLSKRVSRGASGVDRVQVSATRFVWDGSSLVHEIEERAEAASDPIVQERTYLFEEDGVIPLAQGDRVDGGTKWLHFVNDATGAPNALLGSGGDVASTWEKRAWGSPAEADKPGFGSQIRFQGQYEDAETNLFYNRFRYYDPDAARFVSSDPIGLEGGLNLQRYVPNPFTYADPLGLATVNFAGSPALYPAGPGQANTVTIQYTGARSRDFAAANAAACITSAAGNVTQRPPAGYTWHHVADYNPTTNTGTMQLVATSAHSAVGHTGGCAQYTAAHGGTYGR